ncbi:hypothetical protein RJT34_02399 [Clitoria ternatea]|uniref:Uncharacterized protein n=1 Tax=Clitoria ternatea TaxID=43366 RepID=A0AAN9KKF3_CLITE
MSPTETLPSELSPVGVFPSGGFPIETAQNEKGTSRLNDSQANPNKFLRVIKFPSHSQVKHFRRCRLNHSNENFPILSGSHEKEGGHEPMPNEALFNWFRVPLQSVLSHPSVSTEIALLVQLLTATQHRPSFPIHTVLILPSQHRPPLPTPFSLSPNPHCPSSTSQTPTLSPKNHAVTLLLHTVLLSPSTVPLLDTTPTSSLKSSPYRPSSKPIPSLSLQLTLTAPQTHIAHLSPHQHRTAPQHRTAQSLYPLNTVQPP